MLLCRPLSVIGKIAAISRPESAKISNTASEIVVTLILLLNISHKMLQYAPGTPCPTVYMSPADVLNCRQTQA